MVITEKQFDSLSHKYGLSQRQILIMREFLSGQLSNKPIAKRLGNSPGTIQIQINRIYAKTFTRSRTELLYLFVADAKKLKP